MQLVSADFPWTTRKEGALVLCVVLQSVVYLPRLFVGGVDLSAALATCAARRKQCPAGPSRLLGHSLFNVKWEALLGHFMAIHLIQAHRGHRGKRVSSVGYCSCHHIYAQS